MDVQKHMTGNTFKVTGDRKHVKSGRRQVTGSMLKVAGDRWQEARLQWQVTGTYLQVVSCCLPDSVLSYNNSYASPAVVVTEVTEDGAYGGERWHGANDGGKVGERCSQTGIGDYDAIDGASCLRYWQTGGVTRGPCDRWQVIINSC